MAWETAFLATSLALGASREDAQAAMSEPARRAAGTLDAKMNAPSRATRAQALAAALGAVAVDLERMKLA